jgi:hypothetical protein
MSETVGEFLLRKDRARVPVKEAMPLTFAEIMEEKTQAQADPEHASMMQIIEATARNKERALDVQVGGNHYKKYPIQPVEYIHANGIGYFEGNVIKYVTRWRDKNGIADLEKAQHYLRLLVELETERTRED